MDDRMASLFGVNQPDAECALAFYDRLEAEVLDNEGHLSPEQHACLSRYYGALAGRADRTRNVALRSFYRYNWTRRVMPMLDLVRALPRRDASACAARARILDAGCGIGTESIFWSVLREDVEVTGVDIAQERLEVAKARQAAYERRLGRALNLRFHEQDVLSALGGERLDLVWAMESISHIDPAQEFLARAYESLSAGGTLVISDSHILNPAMAWRVLRLRASGVQERTSKTLASGESLSYAQERLFAVGQLARMLREAGFRSVSSQLGIYFPPALARSLSALMVCARVDSLLSQVPLVRNLGGIYTMAARK
jgi:2-polyprenyl-3-methyl-5-hydroxy-6-metoxy-1,4-benzoquinol methylase